MPGLEHEVSEMTKRTDDQPWGCWNLTRHRKKLIVQDGWTDDGRRTTVDIDDFGSRECRYDHSKTDPRCRGCMHIGTGEVYSAYIKANGK